MSAIGERTKRTRRSGRRRAHRLAASLAGLIAGLCGAADGTATAGEADVVRAIARCTADSVCRFRVSVRHADEGWEHYANRWEVLTPDGEVLATRVLRHPHVREQPFTRDLAGVRVPPDLEEVVIRAGDSVHGLGGTERTIPLVRPKKP